MSPWRRLYDLSMALLIFFTGVGLCIGFGDSLVDLLRMASWERHPCTLGVLRVDHLEPTSSRYVVRGSVRYRYAGEDHVSTRLALDPLRFDENGYGEYYVYRLKQRASHTCRVNPRDPSEAVLMIGRSAAETASYWIFAAFTAMILVVGAWLVLLVASERGDP